MPRPDFLAALRIHLLVLVSSVLSVALETANYQSSLRHFRKDAAPNVSLVSVYTKFIMTKS
jgi:hypothetical protein